MTIIILQMPELEDLGCVGAFDSRATEFNIEVFIGVIFTVLSRNDMCRNGHFPRVRAVFATFGRLGDPEIVGGELVMGGFL